MVSSGAVPNILTVQALGQIDGGQVDGNVVALNPMERHLIPII
jgi:hypothetical protein